MAPSSYVPQSVDLGAHALARAKLTDKVTLFTGANNARANARIARFSPPRFFVGASTAKAEARASRCPDKTAGMQGVGGSTKKHTERMARLADVHV